MKKIKKFKINIRQREVLRLLKSTARIEITPQLEQAVLQESQRLAKIASPAAIYETLQKEKVPQELAFSAPPTWVAASFFLITISSVMENEIKEAQRRGEQILGQMLHAISLEALEQATNFVERLLVEEAKEENCEFSDRVMISESPAWETFFTILPGDKVGVQLLANGTLQPLYSSAGILYWIPVKKHRSNR
jgi:hypothetical protein